MSVGRYWGEDSDGGDGPTVGRFADHLHPDEEVQLSWTATGVRWATQWESDPDARTEFVATGRRIVFESGETPTSIGYQRVRAVTVESPDHGPDLSTALFACGGVCLLVGLVVATGDLLNGLGLVTLAVGLLVAGGTTGDRSTDATVTIVIGNERQRLTFSADEAVCAELTRLAGRQGSASGRATVADAEAE